MLKKISLILSILLISAVASFAQGSCSCSVGNGGCSASQTCGSGEAVCVCSASGCSSSCSRGGGELLLGGLTRRGVRQLRNATNPETISKSLSKAIGKEIVFKPASSGFKFNFSMPKKGPFSHWDVLEYLPSAGTLKINGGEIKFWQGLRNTLLKGGEFNICAGNAPAQTILNEIKFLSGKSFKIVAGDSQARFDSPIKGNSLAELIENLSKSRGVTIVEN